MSRVGQISIARPGAPLELEFDEGDLQDVIENKARPGDHITLYPGDYTIWDQDNEIEIQRDINISILPGATIDYVSAYQFEDYKRKLPRPTNSDEDTGNYLENDEFNRPSNVEDEEGQPSHPLAPNVDKADRYKRPNFVGHVENIVDMNFGSEWAFKSDLELLRGDFKRLDNQIEDFVMKVNVESQNVNPIELEFGEIFEIRTDENIEADFGRFSRENINKEGDDEGIFIKLTRPELNDIVSKVSAGNKLQMADVDGTGGPDVTGEVRVEHEVIDTLGNPQNSEATFIQSLEIDDGHVVNVESNEVVKYKEREPRPYDGKDGDVWLVDEADFVRDVFVSTREPRNSDGLSGPPIGDSSAAGGGTGDIWIVNETTNAKGNPGRIRISDSEPQSGDGNPGDIWLEGENIQSGDFEIQDVFFKKRSPNSIDGENRDIWTTETDQ